MDIKLYEQTGVLVRELKTGLLWDGDQVIWETGVFLRDNNIGFPSDKGHVR